MESILMLIPMWQRLSITTVGCWESNRLLLIVPATIDMTAPFYCLKAKGWHAPVGRWNTC